MEFKIGHVSMT